MQEFLPAPQATSEPPAPTNIATEPTPIGEHLKVILVSSPQVVNSTIRTLYTLGFAQVTEWSPLQPTRNPNEVMSVLSRNIIIRR